MVQFLGKGASSTVFRVQGEKDFFALKAIQDKILYDRELTALKHLAHPNIISMKGSTVINRHYCLCLEFLPYVSLHEHIKSFAQWRMDEAAIAKVFLQLLGALRFMHDKRIAHHDLNSRNILVEQETGKVVIIDFGYSVMVPFDGSLVKHDFGTPLYLPIEVLEGREHDPRLVDVWGLGVILVEMIQGHQPWKAAHSFPALIQLIQSTIPPLNPEGECYAQPESKLGFSSGGLLNNSNMVKTKSRISWNRNISTPYLNIVDSMLQVDPRLRGTVSSVIDMLNCSGVEGSVFR